MRRIIYYKQNMKQNNDDDDGHDDTMSSIKYSTSFCVIVFRLCIRILFVYTFPESNNILLSWVHLVPT